MDLRYTSEENPNVWILTDTLMLDYDFTQHRKPWKTA